LIQIKNVTKNYGEICGINSITMTIPENSITGFLGINGAGKSTLLKAIAGVHYPSAGEILINNHSIEKERKIIQKDIGFLSEKLFLPPNFFVNEILVFCASVFFQKKERKAAIEQVVNLCQLESVYKKKIGSLSKGFYQRLALALSLIHDPKILILDEPTSGLDPLQTMRIRELIKKLSLSKTILLSTHIMQEAVALCDYICIMHQGIALEQGTISDICTKTNTNTLEEAFLQIIHENKRNT